jgi:hypothetical protein
MRGVVLFEGPAADAVPTIRDMLKLDLHVQNPEAIAQYSKVGQSIVSAALEKHPEQADQFRSGLLSGEHVQVRAAIDGALHMMRDELALRPEFSAARKVGDGESEGTCIAIGPVFVAYAAVFNWAAVAVNVAIEANVAIATAFWRWNFNVNPEKVEPNPESTLLAEQIVDDIATL